MHWHFIASHQGDTVFILMRMLMSLHERSTVATKKYITCSQCQAFVRASYVDIAETQ